MKLGVSLAVFALTLAGCGSDDDSSASTETDAAVSGGAGGEGAGGESAGGAGGEIAGGAGGENAGGAGGESAGGAGGSGGGGGGGGGEPALPSIAEIAQGDDRFETLVQAAVAAELVDALNGDAELTVFAPTDEAFAAVPAGALEALLADKDALTAVLTYHAVPGTHLAAEVVTMDHYTTLQGSDVAITVEGDVVRVNQAQIIEADIIARNGVIHVIDSVLMPEEEPAPQTIVEIAVGNPDFETLVAAVTAAGLVETLSGEGPFTVFAPTDDAFAALPEGTVEALLQDIPTLTDILTYHVIAGEVPAADVVAATELTMLNGDTAEITLVDGNAYIDGAQIIVTDIQASNGIIHVIDTVMLPPAEEPALQNIVEIAVGNADFETLVAAVTAAGLVETLSGEGPFTVFAPTDDAFAALPAGTVEGLLMDIPALTNILTYHVIAGELGSADVVASAELTMLNGATAAITMVDGNVYIDGAQIVVADIPASNGIIHVIGSVMLP